MFVRNSFSIFNSFSECLYARCVVNVSCSNLRSYSKSEFDKENLLEFLLLGLYYLYNLCICTCYVSLVFPY